MQNEPHRESHTGARLWLHMVGSDQKDDVCLLEQEQDSEGIEVHVTDNGK
jgi:hypothetical protein